MLKIGLTGGIGSGKSVVSSLFIKLGVAVYDSDVRAKELTDSNLQIKDGIKKIFGDDLYLNGVLQRKYLASKVFGDKSALAKLNELIHPIVAEDFKLWCSDRELNGDKYVIIESAILIESGFKSYVDQIICVTAPIQTRINRVVKRDGLLPTEVEGRVRNQISDDERCREARYMIINDDNTLITPQIVKLHSILSDEKI